MRSISVRISTPVSARVARQFLSREARAKDREFLDIIVEEADRLNGVVTEFLEYARPTQRKPQTIPLSEPVEKAMSLLLRERGERMEAVGRHVVLQDPVPRVDAAGKVTGATLYPGDLQRADQAHMKILFAGRPHAIIRSLGTAAPAPCSRRPGGSRAARVVCRCSVG